MTSQDLRNTNVQSYLNQAKLSGLIFQGVACEPDAAGEWHVLDEVPADLLSVQCALALRQGSAALHASCDGVGCDCFCHAPALPAPTEEQVENQRAAMEAK